MQRRIQNAGKRLYGQVSDILDYSEMITDTLMVSDEDYEPVSTINDAVAGIQWHRLDSKQCLRTRPTFQARIQQHIRNHDPIGDFAKRYHEQMERENLETELVYAPDARVLVVDDVPMNLLVAKGLLKYTGVVIDTAESGLEALDKMHKDKYDLIFMDHLMPGMDGVECFHRMKEMGNHPNITTPVIILTANAILGAREECMH